MMTRFVGNARVVSALALGCLLLAALLLISVVLNVHQFRSTARQVATLGQQLAQSEQKGAAQLQVCVAANEGNVATIATLGTELHACRGEADDIAADLALARRQRDRARAAAEGEVRVRTAAVEAIVRRDASCSRPLCRALSDELLNVSPAHAGDRAANDRAGARPDKVGGD